MAAFCTKCGNEIPAGVQFCTKCGAQVMAPAAAPMPQQPLGAPPPPPAGQPQWVAVQPPPMGVPPQPMMPPPRSGSALKIVLIIVAVFVGLGILGLGAVGFIGWRVARGVHVNSSTGEVTVHTPEGTISAGSQEKLTAEDLGVDLYPGAKPAESGGGRITLGTGSMVTGIFVTPDSQDQVVQFYKSKANGEALETSQGAVITVKNGENDAVVITVSPNTGRTEGKTQIAIVHTVSSKST